MEIEFSVFLICFFVFFFCIYSPDSFVYFFLVLINTVLVYFYDWQKKGDSRTCGRVFNEGASQIDLIKIKDVQSGESYSNSVFYHPRVLTCPLSLQNIHSMFILTIQIKMLINFESKNKQKKWLLWLRSGPARV